MAPSYTRKCAYLNCTNKNTEITMYGFPVNDPERMEIWKHNSGNRELQSMSYGELGKKYLCAAHFSPKVISRRSKKRIGPAVPYHYLSLEAKKEVDWAFLSRLKSHAHSNSDYEEVPKSLVDKLGFYTKNKYKECSFRNCKNRKCDGLLMFRFPISDLDRVKLWVLNSGNTDLEMMSHRELSRCCVCEAHFPPSCINRRSVNHRLKKNSVPLLHWKKPNIVTDSEQIILSGSAEIKNKAVYLNKPVRFDSGSSSEDEDTTNQDISSKKIIYANKPTRFDYVELLSNGDDTQYNQGKRRKIITDKAQTRDIRSLEIQDNGITTVPNSDLSNSDELWPQIIKSESLSKTEFIESEIFEIEVMNSEKYTENVEKSQIEDIITEKFIENVVVKSEIPEVEDINLKTSLGNVVIKSEILEFEDANTETPAENMFIKSEIPKIGDMTSKASSENIVLKLEKPEVEDVITEISTGNLVIKAEIPEIGDIDTENIVINSEIPETVVMNTEITVENVVKSEMPETGDIDTIDVVPKDIPASKGMTTETSTAKVVIKSETLELKVVTSDTSKEDKNPTSELLEIEVETLNSKTSKNEVVNNETEPNKRRKCSYRNCSTRNVSMFRFPTGDPDVLKLWIRNSGNPKLENLTCKQLQIRFLCVAHFTPSSINKSGRNVRKRLRRDAVPLDCRDMEVEDLPSKNDIEVVETKVIKNVKKSDSVDGEATNNSMDGNEALIQTNKQKELKVEKPKRVYCKKRSNGPAIEQHITELSLFAQNDVEMASDDQDKASLPDTITPAILNSETNDCDKQNSDTKTDVTQKRIPELQNTSFQLNNNCTEKWFTEKSRRKCSYHNCGNRGSDFAMFGFPSYDMTRSKIWIQNSGNSDLESLTPQQLKRRWLCAAHFPVSSMPKRCYSGPNYNVRLANTAVPYHYLRDK